MYRCPNENYSQYTGKRNQIGRKFSDIFDKLLDTNYYEGTPYGKHFTQLKEDGTSKIYVRDILENDLEEFCMSNVNTMKYLVGFTGMGKTTLLRNYFRITNRDIQMTEKGLIIYISFYYSKLNADHPQESVENEIVKYFSRAVTFLLKMNPKLVLDEKKMWIELYDFMEKNKPMSLQNDDIIPDTPLGCFLDSTSSDRFDVIKSRLKNTFEKNKLEYYSNFLKYLLIKLENISDVYLIFDDIESKEAVFHRPVVEVARHIHSCFSCIPGNNIIIKTLVSIRAYTYRSNLDRQLEARREQIERNTIFKRNTVSLNEIFDLRFTELEALLGTEKNAKAKESYNNAVEQVKIVSSHLGKGFSKNIISLANQNICNAMVKFNSILVNAEWIAKDEIEHSGSFVISSNNYRLTTERVFRALACGNDAAYFDNNYNNLFPNILHNDREEGAELYNLLVLRYIIGKGADDLYGETYVQKSEIVQDISNIFAYTKYSALKNEKWEEKITESINYLYDSGILLRSIYDIEDLSADQIERKYSRASKVYLSPRGNYLLSLFQQNSLLLELYRDSIYVDLTDNNRLTTDMSKSDILKYLISYIDKLFDYEKDIITEALPSLYKYQEYFGQTFLISPLLEGVKKNVYSYFKDEDSGSLVKQIKDLQNRINTFTNIIYNDTGVRFKL